MSRRSVSSTRYSLLSIRSSGAIAQLGERVLCKHEVVGSIPSGSTRWSIGRRERRTTRPEKFRASGAFVTARRRSDAWLRVLSVIVKRKHIRSLWA